MKCLILIAAAACFVVSVRADLVPFTPEHKEGKSAFGGTYSYAGHGDKGGKHGVREEHAHAGYGGGNYGKGNYGGSGYGGSGYGGSGYGGSGYGGSGYGGSGYGSSGYGSSYGGRKPTGGGKDYSGYGRY